jgi:hypothetical protein
MFRSSETPAGGSRANVRDRTAAAPFNEPGLLRDGSIDYDFYKVRARCLRQECVAEAGAVSARLARRGLTALAERIAALGERRAPEFKQGR